jgi:hypothetical protein
MLIRYNKKNPYRIESFVFMPGINEVSSKKFAEMKKYTAFQFRIAKKIIEVVDSVDSPSAANDGKSAYADKTVKEMEALIGDIYNISMLEQIKNEDKRQGVQKAVLAQLDKINFSEDEKTKAKGKQSKPDNPDAKAEAEQNKLLDQATPEAK